ncbi:MAG: homoserine dehydrogenase [Phycisphaerales bacterium]|nr:homoserine dehydrogenase [Phycisphaerales bacterium]
MSDIYKIGLIGCGVVGQQVAEILRCEADEISKKTGLRLQLVRVCDKDRSQAVKAGIPDDLFTTQAADIFNDKSIAAVVELVGGTTVAKDFVLRALDAGQDVVTANKALLAKFGREIYRAAHAQNRAVAFEASCGGGIPLILPLRNGLVANRINAIYGILNGTCNYILSEMSTKGKSYAEALAEAQAAGFAELDPTLDVSGGDTAHKLAILASIAFCCDVDLDRLNVEGIEQLDAEDISAGKELGYVCKLLGIAQRADSGISLRVHPAFVHHDHPLASTAGSFNAISVYGNWVGHTLFLGRGAGGKPTASAVVADLIDLASGNAGRTFRYPMLNDCTTAPKYVPVEELRSRFYVRLQVADRPGVMGKITNVFGARQISIRAVTQHERVEAAVGGSVSVVVLTHEAVEGRMREALDEISALDVVQAKPVLIRVVSEHAEYAS